MNPRNQQRDESIKSMLSRLSLGLKKLHMVAMIRFSSVHFIRMTGKLIVAFAPLVISNSSPGLEFTREKKTQPSNYVQLDTASHTWILILILVR